MKRAKLLLLLSIVVIAGVIAFTLWNNLKEKRVVEENEKLPQVSTGGADVRVEKIHFVEDKEGRKTWELEAKVAQQYQGEDLLVVEQVKVTFYAKDGRTFTISGNQARVRQNSKDMELSGDVLLTSSDGYQLKTQKLTYNHAEKKVTTSDPVEIDGELFRLVGRGMLVDFGERRFRVLHQVRTLLKGGLRG